MKIIFAGTPEFAAIHLQSLLDNNIIPIAVYTQPDRRAGRGHKLQSSAVKQLAMQHNIAVYQPITLRSQENINNLKNLKPDLIVVVAYGLILPKEVLEIARFGCLNVHASLLPRWRGAAPIVRAIEAGNLDTGICIMQMDEGLDTGDVLLRKTCPILPNTTGLSLHNELAKLGSNALVEAINNLSNLKPIAQNHADATYASKITKEESKLNWHQSAQVLERKIRAFYPKPATFSVLNDMAIKILQANVVNGINAEPGTIVKANADGLLVACAQDGLNITCAQLPNAKALDFAAIWAGNKNLFTTCDKFK